MPADRDADEQASEAGRTPGWSLAGLWALCVVGLAGLYALSVRTGVGQRLDDAALAGGEVAPLRARRAADSLLTAIDVSTLAIAVAALVAFALIRRRPAVAVVAAVVIGGAVITTELLKVHVLPRPALTGATIFDNSFPSGHATIAMAVGAASILVAPPRWRIGVAVVAIGFGSVVGVATVALGWHRPSDVAGAYCVAVGWAAAAAWVAARFDSRWIAEEVASPAPRIDRRIGRAAVALLVAGWALALAIGAADQLGSVSLRLADAAFVGAAVSIVALATALCGLLVAALARSFPGPD